MKKFLKHFKTAMIVSIAMFIICGLIYPMALTGISQVIFPKQANGSLVENEDGKVVGSSLVGQDFTDERLFHCRPSAYQYNTYTQEEKDSGEYSGVSSGSNNYAVSNPELEKRIQEDIDEFLKENPTVKKEDIPGLDRQVKDFEPYNALEGGEDGLDFYRKITEESKYFLKNKGILAYEVGHDQASDVIQIMKENGFESIYTKCDLQGFERVVIGFYNN